MFDNIVAYNDGNNLTVGQYPPSTIRAASFARNCPQAGFLYKLGANIPEFKRRFFVIKPSSHLYYFVSPHDTEPRGCWDLEGSSVECVERLNDGCIRWILRLSNQTKLFLEARSNGEEWITKLETEQWSYLQNQCCHWKDSHSAQKFQLEEYERKLSEYQMVEKELEMALEDAEKIKQQLEEFKYIIEDLTNYLTNSIGVNFNLENGCINKDDNNRDDCIVDPLVMKLRQTCEQLASLVKVTKKDAMSARKDLEFAQKVTQSHRVKLESVEKQVCQLWEENTSLRKEIKVVKKEKRILVKEVKMLRSKGSQKSFLQDRPVDEGLEAHTLDSEGERLIEELEAEVESSIRLHQQLLAETQNKSNIHFPSADVTSEATNAVKIENTVHGAGLQDWLNQSQTSPIQPKFLSLLDEDQSSDDEDEDNERIDGELTVERNYEADSSVSSVGVELGEGSTYCSIPIDDECPLQGMDVNRVSLHHLESRIDDRRMSFPSESHEIKSFEKQLGLSHEKISHGHQESKSEVDGIVRYEDGKVYHLTFHSRNIGIQFQKVPAPTKMKGLLDEAMHAEFIENNCPSPSPSSRNKIERNMDDTSRMTSPKDSVLVCGFRGFDTSTNNIRPILGARLVAFDGISVERGAWTFESIRKAIQDCERPLTLSFRNDFLTTKQREILAKAISDMNAMTPNPKPSMHVEEKIHSTTPFHKARKPFIDATKDTKLYSVIQFPNDDQSSVSTRSSINQRFSTVSSVANQDMRSFSEAGASSVFTSTLVPLVEKLLRSATKSKRDGKSRYLNGGGDSLESLPSHQDFQNSLL
jgi:PH domain